MKKTTTAILLFLFVCSACHNPQDDQAALKEKLEKTMLDYLYKPANYDSSHLKFHIIELFYSAGDDGYACQFKVNMVEGHKDTTGEMVAKISKDFKTVIRRY